MIVAFLASLAPIITWLDRMDNFESELNGQPVFFSPYLGILAGQSS